MEIINGDINVNLAKKASQYNNINKFVYISASHYTMPNFLQQGYYNGKFKTENAIQQYFKSNNYSILRPSFIYGIRHTTNTALPLQYIGRPLEIILRTSPATFIRQTTIGHYLNSILTPPINVKDVAKAAVDAATSNNIHGILEVDDIYKLTHST